MQYSTSGEKKYWQHFNCRYCKPFITNGLLWGMVPARLTCLPAAGQPGAAPGPLQSSLFCSQAVTCTSACLLLPPRSGVCAVQFLKPVGEEKSWVRGGEGQEGISRPIPADIFQAPLGDRLSSQLCPGAVSSGQEICTRNSPSCLCLLYILSITLP